MNRAALLLAILLALPTAVSAQSQSEISAARDLFRQGLESVRAERWEEARAHFERSYAIAPRLPTLLNLAGAQVQTGQLVAGAESYRRFISEARGGREARYVPQAREALVAVEPRIPRLTVNASPGEGESVTLDGEALGAAAIGVAIPVDPGAPTLLLLHGEDERGREAFTIREGERRTVELEGTADLRVAASAGSESTGPNPVDSGPQPAGDDSGVWIGVGIAIAVVVAAAIAVGIYFGVEAANAPHMGNLGPGRITFE